MAFRVQLTIFFLFKPSMWIIIRYFFASITSGLLKKAINLLKNQFRHVLQLTKAPKLINFIFKKEPLEIRRNLKNKVVSVKDLSQKLHYLNLCRWCYVKF